MLVYFFLCVRVCIVCVLVAASVADRPLLRMISLKRLPLVGRPIASVRGFYVPLAICCVIVNLFFFFLNPLRCHLYVVCALCDYE